MKALSDRGRIVGSLMATVAVREGSLDAELLLSPELVLVSPPEVAARARALLPDPVAFVPTRPATVAVAAKPRRIGAAFLLGFYLFNTVVPLALCVAAIRGAI
jgi:hypothetical protein